MTPQEAARAEAARVYGTTYPERRVPYDEKKLAALEARAEAIHSRKSRRPQKRPKPAQPLHRRDDGIVDDIAVERRMKGERVMLTTRELHEAARRLAAQGLTPTAISKRLHMSGQRVSEALRGAA